MTTALFAAAPDTDVGDDFVVVADQIQIVRPVFLRVIFLGLQLLCDSQSVVFSEHPGLEYMIGGHPAADAALCPKPLHLR